jgi:hypothetical protein
MPYPYFQGYPNYNQMYLQQMQNIQPQQSQQTPQIQNGGFVMVKDINEAMNYPVAPGNSVTFKNESQPYIYTKTLGFSQLDQPIFEVFKLEKVENEDNNTTVVEEIPVVEYLPLEDADKIRKQLNEMQSEIDFLKELIESDTKEAKDEK